MPESRRHLRMAQLGFLLLIYCAWLLWPVCLLPGNLLSIPPLIEAYGLTLFLLSSGPMYLLNILSAALSGIAAVRLILLFIHKRSSRYLQKTLIIAFIAQLSPCLNSLLYGPGFPPLWTWPLRLLPLALLLLLRRPKVKALLDELPEGFRWPFIHEFRLYQQLTEEELAAEEAAEADSAKE